MYCKPYSHYLWQSIFFVMIQNRIQTLTSWSQTLSVIINCDPNLGRYYSEGSTCSCFKVISSPAPQNVSAGRPHHVHSKSRYRDCHHGAHQPTLEEKRTEQTQLRDGILQHSGGSPHRQHCGGMRSHTLAPPFYFQFGTLLLRVPLALGAMTQAGISPYKMREQHPSQETVKCGEPKHAIRRHRLHHGVFISHAHSSTIRGVVVVHTVHVDSQLAAGWLYGLYIPFIAEQKQ